MSDETIQDIATLTYQRQRLFLSLKDTARILEAVRYSAGLSGSQIDRLKAAQNLIAEIEAQEQAA